MGTFEGVPRKIEGSRMFSRCLNGVSRLFKGNFKEVSMMFCKVSRVSQERFMGVLRGFQGCFKEVLKVFQGRLRVVPRVL